MSEWQPIDTAPRVESGMILLFRPSAYQWGKIAPGMFNPDKYAKRPRQALSDSGLHRDLHRAQPLLRRGSAP